VKRASPRPRKEPKVGGKKPQGQGPQPGSLQQKTMGEEESRVGTECHATKGRRRKTRTSNPPQHRKKGNGPSGKEGGLSTPIPETGMTITKLSKKVQICKETATNREEAKPRAGTGPVVHMKGQPKPAKQAKTIEPKPKKGGGPGGTSDFKLLT